MSVPTDKVQTILSFLRWAEGKGVHLAMHGRPPYGKEGTWFLDDRDRERFITTHLLETEKRHGVQPSGVQGVREDPPSSGDQAE
jgi:hypothetical protein